MGVTRKYVDSLLNYNVDTGNLCWKTTRHNRVKIGQIAGSIDSHGYRQIKIDGMKYLSHRLIWLIMTGAWPNEQIDHINGNKLDNKWNNLRLASRSQNKINSGIMRTNKSGYKGVFWREDISKWKASIGKDQKRIFIGHYNTKEEAAFAYNKSALKLFGDFAYLNEVKL